MFKACCANISSESVPCIQADTILGQFVIEFIEKDNLQRNHLVVSE